MSNHGEIRTPRRRPHLMVAAVVAAVLAACAENAPQDIFEPRGPNATKIDNLQRPVFYIAGVVGVIVLAAVAYTLWKFKDRGQDIPEQTHGNPKLEIFLTVLPAVILAGVSVPTVITVFELDKKTDTECVINVTGQQWWWEMDYATGECGGVKIPEPIVTSGELVIPTNTPVILRITSRDVIHSFWIPALNGKRDAVPGRLHSLRLQADEPGLYMGQCTEFCGLSHARMRQAAVALDTADFQAWVDNQLQPYAAPTDELALAGEGTFIANCSKCHQVNGIENADGSPVLSDPDLYVVSGVAPNLTNLMTRTAIAGWTFDLINEECRDALWNAAPDKFGAMYLKGVTPDCFDESKLREWLRNSPAMKPMFADPKNLESTGGKYRGMPNLNLKEDQIDQLIAYLLERK
ncbi:MAG: cytochrome c oxidase subunit II [Actinomycetota bacterium]